MTGRAVAADPSLMSKHLRRRVERRDSTPGTTIVDGALLLSDIVAFTSHIETMSSLGRSAIEEFSDGMGRYIDQVINLVHAHGGDVLHIAGDSLLCLWETTAARDLATAAADAASTALAVQAAVDGLHLGNGRTLQTRIGVAAGTVSLTVAGGVDGRWELMARGDAVAAVEEAERRCTPGGVTVDDTMLALLRGAAGSMPMGGGLHQLTALDDIRTPRADGTAVDGPSGHMWELEVRRLTIGMAKVPELATASPEVGQRILRLFQTIIGAREGVSSTSTDNKGIRLIATFGAPPFAHEDDPARAVDALRAFAAALADEGATCSAGIATGRAIYGVAGNASRRATTVAGEVINVAARLCSTADANLLCDQETAVGAHARYMFTVLNPIIVKGKAQPVPVFEPVGDVVVPRRRRAVLRGRSAELDRLAQLVRPATERSADAIVVSADAGLGKSTLLDDFIALAGEHDLRVLLARTDAIDRTTPFLAWAPVIDDLLGVRLGSADLGRDELVARLGALLGATNAQHATALAAVFGRSARRTLAESAGEEPSTMLPQLIAELVQSAGARTIVVFEDAHWADAGSVSVLRSLRAVANPPAIVVSTRPEALDEVVVQVGGARSETIELPLLDSDAVAQIVVDRLGTDRVPDELLRFVEHRVAGHPYFCEQLLKSLVEGGTVVVNGPTVTLGPLDSVALPSTVEGVIVSRLDRFDAETQQCLKAASVVGRRHDVDVVQACLPTVDVPAVFDRMGADGLVRRLDDRWYEFQHVIARDVVYDLMTDQQRRLLHRIVADHFERRGRVNPATVGRHWRRAAEPALAFDYLERAATAAMQSGSFAGTVALLDEAEEVRVEGALELDVVQRSRLELLRARASYYLGLYTDARRELETVIGLISEPLPTTEAEHVAEHERLEALRGNRSAPSADPRGEEIDAILFETYRTLVKVLYLLGAPGHLIVTVSLRGLWYAEQLGRRLEAASIRAMVCGAYVTIGNTDRFELHQQAAIAVAEGPDGEAVANHVWRMLAVARAGLGDFAGSIEASDRALAAMDPEGQNRDSGIWQTRAAVHLCAGEFSLAESAWRRTSDIARRDGNQRLLRWSRLDEAQTLVGRDSIAEADEVLTSTTVELGPPSDPLGTIEHHYTTAIVRSAQGRHAEAVREARQVLKMVEGVPPSGFHWVEFCSGAVEAMLAALLDRSEPPVVDRSLLVAETQHAIDLLAECGQIFAHVRPRVPLARSLLALVDGRGDDAAALLADAHRQATDAAMEFDAARCVALSWWLDVPGERLPLGPAHETLARLGAQRWLNRIDPILAGER